jgi:hypothetical protein
MFPHLLQFKQPQLFRLPDVFKVEEYPGMEKIKDAIDCYTINRIQWGEAAADRSICVGRGISL